MKRKILCLFLLILSISSLLTLSVSAAPIPALSVLSNDLSLAKCGLLGHEVGFLETDFDALTQSNTDSITILTLPAPESGTLYLSDRPVTKDHKIYREDLSKLTFRPACDKENACSFSFYKNGESGNYNATCTIYMLQRLNFAPTLCKTEDNVSCSTYSGVMTSGTLEAIDPEGDALRFEIASYPKKGTVTITENKYRYTAFEESVGEDSFAVYAIDRYGNRSEAGVISVTVKEKTGGLSYTDMVGHEGYNAALTMSYCGAMTGSVIGKEAVFSPDRPILYGEFIAALTTALGMENTTQQELAVNVPAHLSSFIACAVENDLIAEAELSQIDFYNTISRADAANILCRAMKWDLAPIDGVSQKEQALLSLCSRDILPLCDRAVCPDAPLSRAHAAMSILSLLDRL